MSCTWLRKGLAGQSNRRCERLRPGHSRSRYLLDTVVRGGLAVGLYAVFPAFSDIHRLWERQAGLVPGWPSGVFEYPPIGALYFAPFGLLPSSLWAVVVNGLIMLAAAVVITAILMRLAHGSSGWRDVDVRMWVSSPALLVLLPINWDVLVGLMLLWGVVLVNRSRPVASGTWLGVGTALKISPGSVVLPVLPLIHGWRRRVAFLASGAALLGGSYLAYAAVDPDGWGFHLEFAAFRTDTQSTVWGMIERGLGMFGSGLSMDAINLTSTLTLIVAMAGVTVWVARTRPSFAETAAVAVMVLLALNKVFKPQYVLWVIPFLAWIRASRAKVRILEMTAIMQFAVIYFALPELFYVAETSVRLVILALLCIDIVKSPSVEPAISEA